METAILREKRLKAWHRDWKLNLIERDNPNWEDLAISLGFPPVTLVVMLNLFQHPFP